MLLKGKAWRYGANVDTDAIIPARYLNTSDPEELARHVMEDLDARFSKEVKTGDMVVAEENFGSGSSREHAPLALKAAGVSVVIASSFARIFYRNSINIGLPILECPQAVEDIQMGDDVEVNLEEGTITNLRSGRNFQAVPYPDCMRESIDRGGLEEYVKSRLAGGGGGAQRGSRPQGTLDGG